MYEMSQLSRRRPLTRSPPPPETWIDIRWLRLRRIEEKMRQNSLSFWKVCYSKVIDGLN